MADDNKTTSNSGIIVPFSTAQDEQPEKPIIPEQMPVVPVMGSVLYPNMVFPFFVRGSRAEKAVDAAMATNNFIFVTNVKDLEQNPDDSDSSLLHKTGSVGLILRMMRDPNGAGVKMMVQGIQRARSTGFNILDEGYFSSGVNLLEEKPPEMNDQTMALVRNINSQLQNAVRLGKTLPQEFLTMVAELKEPGKLADLIASTLELEPADAQNVLEQLDTEKRLNYVMRLLAGEIKILEIQNRIKSNVKEEMDDRQRKYYLNEQLKAIQKELGQDDPQQSEQQELLLKIEEANMTEAAEKQARKEVERIARMHPDSAEAGVIRTYLDWMTALPWNNSSEDDLDLKKARKVLEDDHYGLEKIKDRIIESLAVRKLNPNAKSAIICFVGPPGTGKTSLGQSIARSLNREFYRFSVGGVRDESEIRGHRRTYVGALPGRIITGLKNVGTNNPVFMIDEIDKMGSDFRGDPSSAMLEVLDPQQNDTFTDHYIDVPFDLSKVMFITTANVLHTIPAPLRDRMDIIQLAGYTTDEKVQIAARYLVPRQIKDTGLTKSKISFNESALRKIITGYTREAGVRNLERIVGAVCRKVATKVASGSKTKKFTITAKNLPDYLGAPKVDLSMKRTRDEIGVVNGLAWTETGGELLHIEALGIEGKGALTTTGQLGDVMKESVRAALSLARANAEKYGIDKKRSAELDIHIHVPAGAVPKDGPSAGVAMFSVLVSLLSEKPIRSDVAMTGEISLRGTVLPIGGLKEKLIAAKREGIKTALVPSTNRNDVEEIKQEDLKGLEIVYLERVDQALPYLFRDFDKGKKKPAAKKPAKKAPAKKKK